MLCAIGAVRPRQTCGSTSKSHEKAAFLARRSSSEALPGGKAVSRQVPNRLRQCTQPDRHESSLRVASCWEVHVQPQAQKRVARGYRIEGSIVLYRSAARSQFKTERTLPRAEPWWTMVFGVPLFVRSAVRLVFVCSHWHKSPPLRLRGSASSQPGCRAVDGLGTYITCLDCGQKFAYNSKTGRLVDFWGVHDAKTLAGVRRRVDGFFSLLRGLAARGSRLNMRIPMGELVRSVHRLGILTRGQWIKSRRLIASKQVPRSDLKETQIRLGNI